MQCKLFKYFLLVLIIPALLSGCKSDKGKRTPGLLDDSETDGNCGPD